jgi:signal transduction histidine kinase
MKMIFNFIDFLIPKEIFEQSVDHISRVRNYVVMNLFAFAATAVFAFRNKDLIESKTIHLQWLSVFISLIAYFIFRRTRHHIFSMNLILASVFLIMMRGNMYNGGLHAPGIVWLTAMAFAAIVIVGTRWALMWTCIFAGWVTFLYFAPSLGFTIENRIPPDYSLQLKFTAMFGSIIFVSFLTFISENNRRRYLEELEQKNKDIQNLVRVLSHDLSTPISVFQVTLDLLLDAPEGIDPKSTKLLKRMEKASHHMREIVHNVREFQAVASGKTKLSLQPIDLKEIILEAEALFTNKLQDKELILQLDTQKDIPPVLAERRSLFYHVINNLMSNAIKFSHPGQKIELKIWSENQTVYFSIRDYGLGIPEEIQKYLFDSNKKTTRPGTKGEVGTGFGMPLVKAYLENFSAEIHVQSWTESEALNHSGTLITLRFLSATPSNMEKLKISA